MKRLGVVGTLAALSVLALPASAQQGPDFLFHRPWVSLGLSFGYAVPTANSEIFDFTREQLFIERSDFQSVMLQGEVAVRLNEKLDVALGLGWAADETDSEFRKFIGTDNLPIEQTTRFKRVPATAEVKAYLRERGRSLGRFAWVPTRWAPYVGGALGVVYYEFEQQGEFVDFETMDVFRDFYQSSGWTPTAHVLAGAEYNLSPRFGLTGEGRYVWASSKLGRDFVGFDKIDLAGFQATAGISVRF